jgi:hypothetical protein
MEKAQQSKAQRSSRSMDNLVNRNEILMLSIKEKYESTIREIKSLPAYQELEKIAKEKQLLIDFDEFCDTFLFTKIYGISIDIKDVNNKYTTAFETLTYELGAAMIICELNRITKKVKWFELCDDTYFIKDLEDTIKDLKRL